MDRQVAPNEQDHYHEGLNERLLAVVPDAARTIVDVGCANGRFGAALKRDRSDRTVIGVERNPAAAAIARARLDTVHEVDLEIALPLIEPGTVDCVVFGDVIEHLRDPLPLLRAAKTWLTPGGSIACSIPNVTHHSVLLQLFRGDLQYQSAGILDRTPVCFYTYATIMKLLLEAGFAPDIADIIEIRGRDHVIAAAAPMLELLRIGQPQAARHLNAYQYVITGTPLALVDGPVRPITFVSCTNDADQLQSNLLASPCLGPDSPHEVLLYEGVGSAADGLNRGVREATNDLVVLVHQDVYLPSWWPAQLASQWARSEETGPLAVAGAFGVRYREGGRTHVGDVVDRDHLLAEDVELPADVDGLDEMLLVVPRDTPLRFDPALGWHLYGTDIALQAHAQGLRVAVLDLPCHHNSLFSGLDEAYGRSESALAHKWPRELPIVTNSSTVDHDPSIDAIDALRAEIATVRTEAALAVGAPSSNWPSEKRSSGRWSPAGLGVCAIASIASIASSEGKRVDFRRAGGGAPLPRYWRAALQVGRSGEDRAGVPDPATGLAALVSHADAGADRGLEFGNTGEGSGVAGTTSSAGAGRRSRVRRNHRWAGTSITACAPKAINRIMVNWRPTTNANPRQVSTPPNPSRPSMGCCTR